MNDDFATLNKKTNHQQQEQIFRFYIHRSTVEKLEKITNRHYSQNGEKLILEVLKKMRKF